MQHMYYPQTERNPNQSICFSKWYSLNKLSKYFYARVFQLYFLGVSRLENKILLPIRFSFWKESRSRRMGRIFAPFVDLHGGYLENKTTRNGSGNASPPPAPRFHDLLIYILQSFSFCQVGRDEKTGRLIPTFGNCPALWIYSFNRNRNASAPLLIATPTVGTAHARLLHLSCRGTFNTAHGTVPDTVNCNSIATASK